MFNLNLTEDDVSLLLTAISEHAKRTNDLGRRISVDVQTQVQQMRDAATAKPDSAE